MRLYGYQYIFKELFIATDSIIVDDYDVVFKFSLHN